MLSGLLFSKQTSIISLYKVTDRYNHLYVFN